MGNPFFDDAFEVPIQPLPTQWDITYGAIPNGKELVIVKIDTSAGRTFCFMEPGDAINIANLLIENAKNARKARLVVPQAEVPGMEGAIDLEALRRRANGDKRRTPIDEALKEVLDDSDSSKPTTDTESS